MSHGARCTASVVAPSPREIRLPFVHVTGRVRHLRSRGQCGCRCCQTAATSESITFKPSGRTPWALLLGLSIVVAACSDSGSERSATTTPTASTPPPATAVREPSDAVTVVRKVPYRQPNDGSAASTVEIYLADSSQTRPAVVLLHGWGPPGGARSATDLAPLAQEIAKLGSTVFLFGWDSNGGFSADSAADLSCIGGFIGARAAEYGSSPSSLVVVGHSMGAEVGSKLALSSFGLTPAADCVESGEHPAPFAFVGIGGTYGMIAQLLDDDLGKFRVRLEPDDPSRDAASTEEVADGLTAVQAYELDGYSSLPSANDLRVVLLEGDPDDGGVYGVGVTIAFADALRTHGTHVEVVEVPGGGHDVHEDMVFPDTDAGQVTLGVIRDILVNHDLATT